jgi:hypothetical protein
MNTRFDPDGHRYYINDRPVPSVTQVINEVLPGAIWKADEYFLGRGQAVHACMALLARGKCFDYDTAIDGQVTAGRKFFADLKPEVIGVEVTMFSELYQFGMTMDLACKIGGLETIVDWKSSLSEVSEIQVGGYSIGWPAAKRGLIVALQDDGNYKCGEMFKLERRRQEFLACRSVYGIRQRLGLIKSKEVTTDGN